MSSASLKLLVPNKQQQPTSQHLPFVAKANDDNNNIDHRHQSNGYSSKGQMAANGSSATGAKLHQYQTQISNLISQPELVDLSSNANSISDFATISPASVISMYRKSVTGTSPSHPSNSMNSSSSVDRLENEEGEAEDDHLDSSAGHHYHHRMGGGEKGSYEKLINCDDLEIERHQPDRHRSPILLLLRRLCTCSPYFSKFFSALFYAVASFFIVVINKIILTNYK